MGPARSGFGMFSESLGQLDWTGESLRQADHRGVLKVKLVCGSSFFSHSQGCLVLAFHASSQETLFV